MISTIGLTFFFIGCIVVCFMAERAAKDDKPLELHPSPQFNPAKYEAQSWRDV